MMKKMKKAFFYLKILWKSGPLSMVLNIFQYVLFGINGSLLLIFSGQLVNVLATKSAEKVNVIIYVLLISIFSYASIFFQRFSQNIREKHIFSVQQYIDKAICEKIIEIPHDVQDTKSFQDDFSEIKQANSKLYLFVTYFVQLISISVQMISPIILLFKLSPTAMICYFAAAFCFVYLVYKMQFLYWSEYLSNTTLRRKMNYFLGLFTNASILGLFKAFKNEKFFFDKTQDVVNDTNQVANKLVFGENKKYYILQSFMLFIPISIMLLALYAYMQESILVGDVIMYIGVGKQIHSGIISMGITIQKFQKTSLSLNKLYFFIGENYCNSLQSQEDSNEKDVHGIEIKNLTFSYPNSMTPALNKLSLNIGLGKKIAIVGENGAGKTTLVKILLGLYRNYAGQIRINGKDIKYFSQSEFSDFIAPCFQDFLKPNFKLREAVGFSKIDDINKDSKILKNLETVQFDTSDKSILEQQLGTMFEHGIDLSVGNWQKVAMARATFSDCNILIFDEPLAAVDVSTEYQFLEYLNSSRKNTDITIVVSHRMLGMNLFDIIVLLEEGKITEMGTHQELMSLGKKYSQLYEAQQLS